MKPRLLFAILAAYALLLVLACAAIHAAYSIHASAAGEQGQIASIWRNGVMIRRALSREGEPPPLHAEPGERIVVERIVGTSPLLQWPRVVLGLSFVPARDGLRVDIGERVAYLTPDDLLAFQIYDHGPRIEALGMGLGLDVDALERLAADRLKIAPRGLFDKAELHRIRVERVTVAPDQPNPNGATLTRDTVLTSALAAASYLARGVGPDGHFRYLVDGPTNRTLEGYNWPRHSGAVYFVAQAAGISHDPALLDASRRGADLFLREALRWCGRYHCIGTDPLVDLGSSALALLALTEIIRADVDGKAADLRRYVPDLAGFLRSMQRPDGEFMHQFDRVGAHPNDVQFPYYSSEAALALARAHAITHDEADLHAAAAALEYIAGKGWHFFGDRYYFQEEHWTCQAMADTWRDAPNRRAFDLCLHWAAFCRHLQLGPDDSAFDTDGAISMGPFTTPRFTPAASRAEGAIATLDVARRIGIDPHEIELLDQQVRRSLALVIRHQWLPGPSYLFADPAAVRGAIPGSPADWQIRIDYAQHAGSAMLRWLAVTSPGG